MSPDLYTSPLNELLQTGTQIELSKGTQIAEQFAPANQFHLLLRGKIRYSISIQEKSAELDVGYARTPYTPIGWSGLNAPHRYSSSMYVDSKSAALLVWDREELLQHLERRPKRHVAFLKMLCAEARKLVEETGHFLDSSPEAHSGKTKKRSHIHAYRPVKPDEVMALLRRSPFFEIFEESFFSYLATHTSKFEYPAGSEVFAQGAHHDGMYFLDAGEIQLVYRRKDDASIPIRTIDQAGYIFGWTGALDEKNLVTARVLKPSSVCFIPGEILNEYFIRHKDIAIAFYRRILWLVMHQLQTLRARMVMQQYEQESLSIQNLISQNATRLQLDSPLHKIPLLLQNPLTLNDAFQRLKTMLDRGTAHEKYLSTTCLDILKETHKEHLFFSKLMSVYEGVIHYTQDASSREVRSFCAEGITHAFEETSYVIEGWENLPEESGHIFIYNHLLNHEYNTLPNGFQITLDSHFISSLILHKKYGDPGIRIVRIGRGNEFAHQEYYNRLGHINVYTAESDIKELTDELRRETRETFYTYASAALREGHNLLISPEGTSYTTDTSPGIFKAGAFHLALTCAREPLIVPIAIANFDKRVRHNTFKCLIKPPIKVSDYVRSESREEMKRFLESYRKAFSSYIAAAKALTPGKPLIESIHTV